MLASIPHKKICFYHLPTRGRAGIMLGDAWYVSNVSIIFDCSMLYYLLFWTLLGFVIHFYIIFGTNLLTGGPAQNCCFCLFQSFAEKEYQTEWNVHERDFRNKHDPEDLDPTSRKLPGSHEVGGRALLPRGCLIASLTSTPSLLDCICSEKFAPESFNPFGLRLIFLFCETLKQGKNRNWHWALGQ